MLKNILILAMTLSACDSAHSQSNASSFSFDHKPIMESVSKDFKEGDRLRMANDADKALEKMLMTAVAAFKDKAAALQFDADRLQRRGALSDAETLRDNALRYENAADDLTSDWNTKFKGEIPRITLLAMSMQGHETPELYTPMSDWLRNWYHQMKDLLGPTVCAMLHLDDIQTMNEGTPVVLRLKKYMVDQVPSDTVYELYFDPWTSCVAYWLVYAGCEAATMATGTFFMCSLPATLARDIVYKYIAPKYSDKIYARLYQ